MAVSWAPANVVQAARSAITFFMGTLSELPLLDCKRFDKILDRLVAIVDIMEILAE